MFYMGLARVVQRRVDSRTDEFFVGACLEVRLVFDSGLYDASCHFLHRAHSPNSGTVGAL